MTQVVGQGKTIHELTAIDAVTNSDLILIGDASDPLIAKRVTVGSLRQTFGAVTVEEDVVVNPTIETPTWIVEGVVGGWKVSIQGAVTGAIAYIVYYYDEDLDSWTAIGGINETRGSLGAAAGPLTLEIGVPAGEEDEVIEPTYRRFYVVTVTAIERSAASAEKNAWSLAKLPPDFVPDAPVIVEDDDYPYTATRPVYNGFAHIVVMRVNCAAGQAEYIQRYEMQRKRLAVGSGSDGPWTDLPKHEMVKTPNKPMPRALVYLDESAGAVPGSNMLYRVRAVDWNGTISEWSNIVNYQVEEDDTAPDVPVLTITPVQLGIKIVFNEPTQASLPCPDWRYWTLQYSKSGGAWTYIDGKAGQILKNDYTFPVVDADLDATFQFKAKATDWTGHASAYCTATTAVSPLKVTESSVGTTFSQKLQQIATNTSTISTHTTEISQNAQAIALRATTEYVNTQLAGKATTASLISLINVSSEGVTISSSKTEISSTVSTNTSNISSLSTNKANKATIISEINVCPEEIKISSGKISISGSTEFSSGYDPSTKLTATGGAYNSAASGARVRIFPDSNTGIQVTDGTNDVFKCFVGGTDVGDVIIGNTNGQYIKWDNSAATLKFTGTLERLTSTFYLSVGLDTGIYNVSNLNTYSYFSAGLGVDRKPYLRIHDGSSVTAELCVDDGGYCNIGAQYRVNNQKVLGARGASISSIPSSIAASSNDADAAKLSDVQALRTAVSDINARLSSAAGHGLYT